MATPNEAVLTEGYLVKAPDVSKHLHNFKKWHRRWCRLDASGDLFFYDSEKSHKPSGVVHMMQCTRITDAKEKGIQLSYSVAVEVDSSVHYFKMESATSYNQWVKCLAEFAEVSEVGVLEAGPEGLGPRTSSVSSQGRHFSLATKGRFPKKDGWMAKTGSNNKGWNNRFFTLSNGKLYYYKNDKAESSLGSIDLFECQGVKKAAGKKGTGFDIMMPGRVYNLSVDGEGEQNDWILAITNTLSTIADIKGSPLLGGRRGGSSPSPSDNASVDSQELVLEEGSAPGQQQPRPSSLLATDSLLSGSYSPNRERKDKDSVVQLLEAEVEALRGKVSSLEAELQSSSSVSSELQHKLSESRKAHSSLERQLTVATESHAAQVTQLEKQKTEVEAINDSLSTQLEEQLERVQELDEEHDVMRHELEEAQSAATAAEEELTDTQQKLKEIEEVARDLEGALRKRGDSEPQTPVTAHRSLTLLSRSETADLTSSLDLPARTSQDTFELKQTLETAEKEKDKLLQQLTELKMKHAAQEEQMQALQSQHQSEKVAAENQEVSERKVEAAVSEERLKHLMEMENLRKDLEQQFEAQRKEAGRERTGLEDQLAVLQDKCGQFEQTLAQEVGSVEAKLREAQDRISQLESELAQQLERVGQLQAEKEKALSDLKAIRKLNRTMEKKISDGEVDTRTPSTSPTLEGAEYQQRVMEAEQKTEGLKAALLEVEKERDLLKVKLEKVNRVTPNGSLDVNLSDASMFRFRSKTSATIASSSMGPSAPSLVGRTRSFAQSQDKPVTATLGGPPPKPKRPPKELVNKYHSQQQQQQQQEEQIQASQPSAKNWSASGVLQSLFSRRTVKF